MLQRLNEEMQDIIHGSFPESAFPDDKTRTSRIRLHVAHAIRLTAESLVAAKSVTSYREAYTVIAAAIDKMTRRRKGKMWDEVRMALGRLPE